VARLGEYHKRRILASFQHADELLSKSLHAMAPAQSNSQLRCVQDLSPSETLRIESHIELIREQMRSLLERFQITLPERSTPSSWILKTNLTLLDIAFEDLYPHKMKGYGEMDPGAASELTQSLQEIHGLVSRLLKALK
jgi:hypothetical protein